MVVNTEGTVGTSFPNSNWASLNANSAAHLSKQEYTRSIEEKQATTGHACVRPVLHRQQTRPCPAEEGPAYRGSKATTGRPRGVARTRPGNHACFHVDGVGQPNGNKGAMAGDEGGSRGAHLTLITGAPAARQRSHTSP